MEWTFKETRRIHKGKRNSDGLVIKRYQVDKGERISTHSSGAVHIDWGMELHDMSRQEAAERLRELRKQTKRVS
jgi:hypothetical protein